MEPVVAEGDNIVSVPDAPPEEKSVLNPLVAGVLAFLTGCTQRDEIAHIS